jgi:ubiquinone/menaquinone biosynthesis C-methylase UbiE
MDDTNYWLDDRCARAFWDQHRALPYQELLQDTARWLEPKAGERWLDLGCGGGQLSAVLWQRSQGQVAQIVAMDCAAANAEAIQRLERRLNPAPLPDQLQFRQGNFSDGLEQFDTASFDGVVSGLAISYAEHCDPTTGRFTDQAYNRLLAELHRVLKPGGQLVFSVNVPDPNFWSIFWKSLRLGIRLPKPFKVLVNGLKMMRYGAWLRREARRGRFHFFSLAEINHRLRGAGFREMRFRLSYAGQAYVVGAVKPSESLTPLAGARSVRGSDAGARSVRGSDAGARSVRGSDAGARSVRGSDAILDAGTLHPAPS